MPAKRTRPGPRPLSRLQRRVLAEWRGVDEGPDLTRHEHPLGEVLSRILDRAGLADRCMEEELTAAWRQVVGEFIAANSKPVGFRDGVLQVAVLQPSVRYALQGAMKRDLLTRLRRHFPGRELADIRFMLG